MTDAKTRSILETTKGKVVIEMRPDLAPGHVARIKELVNEDSTMASCSIASSTASWRRPAARMAPAPAAPARSSRPSSTRSRISAAPSRWRARRARIPATASSSSASPTPRFLNGQYTVWGKVTEGMENVDKIKRGEPVMIPTRSCRPRWATRNELALSQFARPSRGGATEVACEAWSARVVAAAILRDGRRAPSSGRQAEQVNEGTTTVAAPIAHRFVFAHPCVLGEPLVVAPANRAIEAREEHRRRAEACAVRVDPVAISVPCAGI